MSLTAISFLQAFLRDECRAELAALTRIHHPGLEKMKGHSVGTTEEASTFIGAFLRTRLKFQKFVALCHWLKHAADNSLADCPTGSLFQNQSTPDALKRDILGIVTRLYGYLTSYHLLANNNGAELADIPTGADTAEILSMISLVSRFIIHVLDITKISGTVMQEMQSVQSELDHECSFVDTLYELCARPRDNGAPDTHREVSDLLLKECAKRLHDSKSPGTAVMFSERTMRDLTTMYSDCTRRMRTTLSLIFLIGSSVSSDFANSRTVLDLGLKNITRNQFRAQTEPPPEFGELDGSLEDLQLQDVGQSGQTFGIAEFVDSLEFRTGKVVVDIRRYNNELSMAVEEDDQDKMREFKAPIRHLCWFLHGSSERDSSPTDDRGMQTLDCIGYRDEPHNQQSILIYRLPRGAGSAPTILSLHEFIMKAGKTQNGNNSLRKPPLGDRIQIAYLLASTVFGIHSSGWVHKDISSRSILMFHNPKKHEQLVPYLIRWGIARSTDEDSALVANWDPESNIYRHPQRYGQPEKRHLNEHDIYSLGVVLLEIGMWQTVSKLFARPIKRANEKRELPLRNDVKNYLLQLAKSEATFGERLASNERISCSLSSEVGDIYANVVELCLSGTFDVVADTDNEKRIEASLRFRKQIIEPLEARMHL